MADAAAPTGSTQPPLPREGSPGEAGWIVARQCDFFMQSPM